MDRVEELVHLPVSAIAHFTQNLTQLLGGTENVIPVYTPQECLE